MLAHGRFENVHPRRQKGFDRRFDARHDYSIWEMMQLVP